jgi:hypothetical protein
MSTVIMSVASCCGDHVYDAIGGQFACSYSVKRCRPDIVQRSKDRDPENRRTVEDERSPNPLGMSAELGGRVGSTSDDQRGLGGRILGTDEAAEVRHGGHRRTLTEQAAGPLPPSTGVGSAGSREDAARDFAQT